MLNLCKEKTEIYSNFCPYILNISLNLFLTISFKLNGNTTSILVCNIISQPTNPSDNATFLINPSSLPSNLLHTKISFPN